MGDIEARNNFVIEKYVKGVEDAGDDIDLGVVKVGHQPTYYLPTNLPTYLVHNISG